MDTARYRKMCNCPEIQSKWKQYLGDRFVKEGDSLCSYRSLLGVELNADEWVWLPRLGDLVEMLHGESYTMEYVSGDFFCNIDWMEFEGDNFCECVIKAIMWALYDKYWNDEKGWTLLDV